MKTSRTLNNKVGLALSLCLFGAGLGLFGCQNTVEGLKEDTNKNAPVIENAAERAVDATKRAAQTAAEKTKDATANSGDAMNLTPKVKSAILANDKLNNSKNRIDVDTKDGVVYLKGHVISNDEKRLAGDIAAKTVKEAGSNDKVMNQLTVEAH
jgi:osmotically-inducible protein OsmY